MHCEKLLICLLVVALFIDSVICEEGVHIEANGDVAAENEHIRVARSSK